MRWWRSIGAWLPWSSREHNEGDLDREISTHLELEAEEQQESGLPPDEARHAARRVFGNVTLVKEEVRRISLKTSLEQVGQDLRYAARQFRKNLGFAMVAVLTMGLGIGANTAVFSVIHALLLREPPYTDPSRLASLWQSLPKAGEIRLGTSPAEYLDYRDRNRACASIAGYYRTAFDLTDGYEPDRIKAACVTASLFPTLGIAPLLGQTFTATEEQPGAAKVALLSYAYWRQRYGGDPRVLGAALKLNEQPYTVVGVMPACRSSGSH